MAYKNIWGKALSGILAFAILGALAMLGYTIAVPPEEKFTEFYILDLNGGAGDYPSLLMVGEEGKVIASITNREGETVSYWVEVRVDGVTNNEVKLIKLEHKEKWEGMVSFTPTRVGDKQKVEFLLYNQGQEEACLGLHLWIDIRNSNR